MSGFIEKSVIALALLGLAGFAHAVPLSSLEVQTNRPASVFVDGQLAGKSPLTVTGIHPGVHNVKIVDDTTGFARYKPFVAPHDRTLDQRLVLEFQGGKPLTDAEKLAQDKQAQQAPGAIAEVEAPAPVALRPPPLSYPYSNYGHGTYAYGGYPNSSPYYRGFGGFGLGFGFGRGFRRGGFGGYRGGFRGGRGCRR